MTILQALQTKFASYPMSPAFYEMILVEAGLNGADEYTKEVSESKEFNYAWANGLFALVDRPQSVTEGDYSVSKGDSDSIWRLINWLRTKYGLDPIGVATVKFLKDWC